MTLPAPFAPLAAYRRFVTYTLEPDVDRPGKTIKRPTDVRTGAWCNSNDPAHQYSYAEAAATGRPVGFVFAAADGFVFLDLDDCREGDGWNAQAQEICAALAGAAIEVSQSGNGMHIVARAATPPHACKNIPAHLELYTDQRFCALTGTNAVGDASTDHTAAITAIVNRYFPPNPHGEIAGWSAEPVEGFEGPTDDTELIKAAMASGKKNAAARFGGGVTFGDLWTADVVKLATKWPGPSGGYDASMADAALASHLAFWTGKNCERIRSLMQRSALARPKWEERPDWLDTTIMKAASVVTNVAKGRPVAEPPPADLSNSESSEYSSLAGVSFDGDLPAVPARELIKALLPIEGIAFLGGQSGAGKTFVAIDLAVAVAADGKNEFFGRKVKERVAVAIFAAEGEGTIAARLHVSKGVGGVVGRLPIAHFSFDINLSKDSDVDALCEKLGLIADKLKANFGVRLGMVIIDTVAAAFGMENENDNAEAARIIRSLRRLGVATGALIVPVHHYGKAEDSGLRGASGFRAGADAVLSVTAHRNNPTGNIRDRKLSLAKSRTNEEGPVSGFDLVPSRIGVDDSGEPFGSCAIVPNDKSITPARNSSESQSSIDFRSAFSEALAIGDNEPQPPLTITAPTVRLSLVRNAFFARRDAGTGDKHKQVDAARKAFANALKRLELEFTITRDNDGVVWISAAPN